MSQYIGKTISLISVTDNRYVGLLEGIDSDKGTVTLREVRCFGTEGRKKWGPDEIYPNATVYKSVKFNGNEVKDLSILDVRPEEVQPQMPPASALQEAATPAAQSQPQQQPQQPQVPAAVAGYGVYAPVPTATETSEKPTSVPSSEPKTTHQEHHRKFRSNDQEHHTQNSNPNQRQKHHASLAKKIEIPTEDFDFQTNNAKFTKDGFENSNAHEHDTAETTGEYEPIKPDEPRTANPDSFYNKKSSFFDTISTSTDLNTNIRWQEEKAMNLDTFGQASARPRFGGRGSSRGARGGRGRGGRGRGGNNHNRGGHNRGNYDSNRDNSNNTNFGQQHHSQNVEF